MRLLREATFVSVVIILSACGSDSCKVSNYVGVTALPSSIRVNETSRISAIHYCESGGFNGIESHNTTINASDGDWSVVEEGCGTLTPNGNSSTYTAPSSAKVCTVRVDYDGKSGTATVTVTE